jgi:type II secretory pathway component PulF
MAKAKTKNKVKIKNATYTWECTNKRSNLIKGETTAASADVVKSELRNRALLPKKARSRKKAADYLLPKKNRLPRKISPFSAASWPP